MSGVAALDHWFATGAADLEDRLPVVLAELRFATDDPSLC